jgi:type VI secretion system FHA domain protein
VILTLEATGPQAAELGSAAQQVFDNAGGTIGRSAENQWVLAHPYVSGRHARIRYEQGRFTIEDLKSSNGVFINSLEKRLPLGEQHALESGDTIFIDPFEIRVSIADRRETPASSSLDPFLIDDPFAPSAPAAPRAPAAPAAAPPSRPASEPLTGEGVDPLRLLGLDQPAVSPRHVPRAADLAGGSPLRDHYRPPEAPAAPPEASTAPPERTPREGLIPDDYNPLLSEDSGSTALPARPVPPSPRMTDAPVSRPPARRGRAADPPAASARAPSLPPVPQSAPPVAAPSGGGGAPQPGDPAAGRAQGALDLAEMLAGAGLDPAVVTPELTRTFGRILQVVVTGVMDALKARQRVKDEFGMRLTMFRPADNNPLKFSANVEDALHNLLVKRNAAYLGPVEAFEDAFADIRNHQMAMLAGMRQAFETMLAAFDPDRIEGEFERQMKRNALLSMPGKLRYWDLYREKFGDMVKDPEASFAELFGDEFARAYEEQLERLKAHRR